ncbi:MAG: hypothetical protein GX575_23770 [Candidatus Anammoximicrobium sp.]|nr:hypothetical protein [Candidatus Anammoximicrobium sp.]
MRDGWAMVERSRVEQPMKHRQEQDPLRRQIESSSGQQRRDDLRKLEFIRTADHGGDALPTAPLGPRVLDALKVPPGAGLFLAEEHGGFLAMLPT